MRDHLLDIRNFRRTGGLAISTCESDMYDKHCAGIDRFLAELIDPQVRQAWHFTDQDLEHAKEHMAEENRQRVPHGLKPFTDPMAYLAYKVMVDIRTELQTIRSSGAPSETTGAGEQAVSSTVSRDDGIKPTGKSHELKVWPLYWKALASGRKTFEYRRNDRDFRVGDTLHLREWDPQNYYSGKNATFLITYIAGGSLFPEGYVCMSIVPTMADTVQVKTSPQVDDATAGRSSDEENPPSPQEPEAVSSQGEGK